MNVRRLLLVASVVLSVTASAKADEPKAIMTQRGKLLLSDDFSKPLGSDWKQAKGKWELSEGAIKGSELAADMHGAVIRRNLSFDNAIIQVSFKLEGAKQFTISVNAEKGHLCRALVNSTGFTVKKDSLDHNKTDKPAILQRVETPISPATWHTIVFEIHGKEILASLDGQHVGFGSHPGLERKKGNVGLTVAGQSALFKDLRIWEATPNPGWEAAKAKLLASRPKGS